MLCFASKPQHEAVPFVWDGGGGTAELQSPSVPLSGLRGLQTISLW